MNVKEKIKSSVVFFSLSYGILFTIIGLAAYKEYQEMQEKCIYLEKQIEEQTMLIEYLKGDSNA